LEKENNQSIKELYLDTWSKNNTPVIIHCGPTNSGKTFNALKALKEKGGGIYLSPLRILAWEVYEKLNSDGYSCSLLTGEEKIIKSDAKITSATIEIVDTSESYDVVIVDEAFMISDRDRGKAWSRAIMEVRAKELHLITNLESLDLFVDLLTKFNRQFTINKYERKTPLLVEDTVYSLHTKNIQPKTIFVVFSRIEALYTKFLLQKWGIKTAVLYGNLPPDVKREQMKKFNAGECDVMVSTDVIGMGVNLPCDNIVFLEVEKYDGNSRRELLNHEVKQIGGRAGRYGFSDKGVVHTTQSHFIEDIKNAFKDNTKNKIIRYGITEDIYKKINFSSPLEKLNSFKHTLIFDDKNYLLDDMKTMFFLASNHLLNKLGDDLTWKLITCPVNNMNENFWFLAVQSIKKNKKISFTKKYTLKPIRDVDALAKYEALISFIDLYLYFYNNKTLNQHLSDDKDDKAIILKEHKEIINNNINDFLLNRKLNKKINKQYYR
jgi:ATP-dependent RNA helicase SUPV3L1/SUV3